MPKHYTKEIWAYSDEHELHLMVAPDADLDGEFGAWCLDENEPLIIWGWMFSVEEGLTC